MKREEKNAIACRRILTAAIHEFSEKGYDGASLNTVCAENNISKGIIYHHFKDKDELYLQCVGECYSALTEYLKKISDGFSGSAEENLQEYFAARFRFFADNPLYLGIFIDSVIRPPSALYSGISDCRKEFDALNISVLTKLLYGRPLRKGLTVAITEDFRAYMDFFNMRFKTDFNEKRPLEAVLREHEERCRRQLDIFLYGVIGDNNEK